MNAPVRAVQTATLASWTYAAAAGTLAAPANGGPANPWTLFDSISSPALNDPLEVNMGLSAIGTPVKEAGIYTITQLGDSTHPTILTRRSDLNTDASFAGGVSYDVYDGATSVVNYRGARRYMTSPPIVSGLLTGTNAPITFDTVRPQSIVGEAAKYGVRAGISNSLAQAASNANSAAISKAIADLHAIYLATDLAPQTLDLSAVGGVRVDAPIIMEDGVILTSKGKVTLLDGGKRAPFIWASNDAPWNVIGQVDKGTNATAIQMWRPLAQMVAGTSVTFAVTANTVTRTTGSWLSDGFAVGQTVQITGTASNNVTGTVSTLTATVMTLSATLANETTAAAFIRTTATDATQHPFIDVDMFCGGLKVTASGASSGFNFVEFFRPDTSLSSGDTSLACCQGKAVGRPYDESPTGRACWSLTSTSDGKINAVIRLTSTTVLASSGSGTPPAVTVSAGSIPVGRIVRIIVDSTGVQTQATATVSVRVDDGALLVENAPIASGSIAFGVNTILNGVTLSFPAGNYSGPLAAAQTLPGVSLVFAASGTTITRTVGSWLTDGFVSGQVIKIAGTVSNNIQGVISSLTATVMTVQSAPSLVNETTISATIVSFPASDQHWENTIANSLSSPAGTILPGSVATINYATELDFNDSTGDINLYVWSDVQTQASGSNTLTFAAPANTVTRSSGSWLTDGFLNGAIVKVSGSLSNNVTATITALTATVMTLNVSLVNEASTTALVVIGSLTTHSAVAAGYHVQPLWFETTNIGACVNAQFLNAAVNANPQHVYLGSVRIWGAHMSHSDATTLANPSGTAKYFFFRPRSDTQLLRGDGVTLVGFQSDSGNNGLNSWVLAQRVSNGNFTHDIGLYNLTFAGIGGMPQRYGVVLESGHRTCSFDHIDVGDTSIGWYARGPAFFNSYGSFNAATSLADMVFVGGGVESVGRWALTGANINLMAVASQGVVANVFANPQANFGIGSIWFNGCSSVELFLTVDSENVGQLLNSTVNIDAFLSGTLKVNGGLSSSCRVAVEVSTTIAPGEIHWNASLDNTAGAAYDFGIRSKLSNPVRLGPDARSTGATNPKRGQVPGHVIPFRREAARTTVLGDQDATLNASDVVNEAVLPTSALTAARTIRLAGLLEGNEWRIAIVAQSFNIVVKDDASGSTIDTIAAGTRGTFAYRSNASAYVIST
jgi:hypothetical protein